MPDKNVNNKYKNNISYLPSVGKLKRRQFNKKGELHFLEIIMLNRQNSGLGNPL